VGFLLVLFKSLSLLLIKSKYLKKKYLPSLLLRAAGRVEFGHMGAFWGKVTEKRTVLPPKSRNFLQISEKLREIS